MLSNATSKRVASRLYQPSTVLAYRRVDPRASQCAQAPECPGVIQADQPAIAGHIGINDGNQLPTANGRAGEVRANSVCVHRLDLSHVATGAYDAPENWTEQLLGGRDDGQLAVGPRRPRFGWARRMGLENMASALRRALDKWPEPAAAARKRTRS